MQLPRPTFPTSSSRTDLALCYHLRRPPYASLRQLLSFLPISTITSDAGDSHPLMPLPIVPLAAPVPVPIYIRSSAGKLPEILPSPPRYIYQRYQKWRHEQELAHCIGGESVCSKEQSYTRVVKGDLGKEYMRSRPVKYWDNEKIGLRSWTSH